MTERLFPLDAPKLEALEQINHMAVEFGLATRYHDALNRSGSLDLRLYDAAIQSGELTEQEQETAEEVASRGRQVITAYRAELPIMFRRVLHTDQADELQITKIDPRTGIEPAGAALAVGVRLTPPTWFVTNNFEEGDIGYASALWSHQVTVGIEL